MGNKWEHGAGLQRSVGIRGYPRSSNPTKRAIDNLALCTFAPALLRTVQKGDAAPHCVFTGTPFGA